jgi:PKD repeat protein
MKKITSSLKILAILFLTANAFQTNAQCAANFSYTVASNGTVLFNANCTPMTSSSYFYWVMGGSTNTLYVNTPTVTSASTTYSANGIYTVTLLYGVSGCTASTSQTISVNTVTAGCQLVANFSYSQGSGGAVNFNNTSSGTVAGTTYSWTFGDGGTSTSASPSHTYSGNGTYLVTLYANNNSTPSCTSTKTMNVVVNTFCNLTAGFTYTLNSNGNVSFQNTTSPLTGNFYYWNFGNASTSTLTNPSVNYSVNGTYTVKLLATQNNTVNYCTDSTLAVINITNANGCGLNANFFSTSGSNGQVNFSNTSSGTYSGTTYSWNFGDGGTSTLASPSHTYSTNGVYSVTFTANNNYTPACVSTKVLTVSVTSGTCVAIPFFSLVPSGTPKLWYAMPASTLNVVAAQWSWGDGTSTSTLFASHLYSVASTYSICLSVTVACGASASYCTSQAIYKSGSGADNEMIRIDVIEAGTTGIRNTGINNLNYAVYPNPAAGQFNLKLTGVNAEKADVVIYNVMGMQVFKSNFELSNGSIDKQINLSAEPDGVYFIELNAAGKSATKKIVLTH